MCWLKKNHYFCLYILIRPYSIAFFFGLSLIVTVNTSDDRYQCRQSARCDSLKNNTCLGVTLPYKYTSLGVFASNHLRDEIEIKDFLTQWKVLQSVPRCWASVEPFLCTLYLPKCDDGQVYLPSYDMCKTARNNCRFIEMYFGAEKLPSFLNCDQNYTKPNCGYGYQDIKLNPVNPAKCKYPLTSTEDSNIWYPGFEGCALQCDNPLLSVNEQATLTNFIKFGVTISSIFLLVCAANFLVDWKSANKYPPVIIFYLTICLLSLNVGWSLQFWWTKNTIVCRSDNTRRYGEPSTAENFSCLLVFALIYYFSVAAMVWLVILSFLWNVKFRQSNGFKEFTKSKEGYFHLTAWSVPFIFTIIILSIGEVDSSPMLGICYVGLDKSIVKIFMVFVPLLICASCSLFYLIRSVTGLKSVRDHESTRFDMTRKWKPTINKMIYRIVAFASYIFLAVLCSIFCSIYEYNYSYVSEEILKKRIICFLDPISTFNPTKVTECQSKIGINLFYTYLQLFIVFSSGVAVSLWSFTPRSVQAWRRLILKKCDMNPNRPISSRKHDLIAKNYNKHPKGLLVSIVQSYHGDPVDMNLTSARSTEISSEFARFLPNMLLRRGGITSLEENHYLKSHQLNNNNSSISDIFQPRYSFDRRGSFDSRISNESEMAEIMMKHVKRKTKKERKRLFSGLNDGYKRETDSPTQSFILKNPNSSKNGVTRATSTGDLINQVPPSGAPHVCSVVPSFPMAPLSFPNPPFSYPLLPPQQPPPPKQPILSRRCNQKPPSNHPFTHGMSQQGESLTNPLFEKRRPDSRLNGLQSTSPISVSRQQNNLGIGYMNSLNYQIPMMGGAQYGSYLNSSSMMYPCLGNTMPHYLSMQSAPAPAMPNSNTPSIFTPYYCPPCQPPYSNGGVGGYKDLEELQKITQEREKYLGLITGVETASEDGSHLPIHMTTDSEGVSDVTGTGDRVPTDNCAQRIVDERLQRTERNEAIKEETNKKVLL